MIRVVTYNIHGGKGTDGERDYGRIGRFLQDQAVDVALIQELDTRPEHCDPGAEMESLLAGHFKTLVPAPTISRGEHMYGNAVLSRFPVLRSRVIDISGPGYEPRNILEVFLETPEGVLHVVNTHKGLRAVDRWRQMGKLRELLATRTEAPLFVGGDINEWRPGARALRALNKVLHPLPTPATFPTMFPLLRLDRIWCFPKGLVQRTQVLRTKETRIYSDHYPILAEIRLPKK